MKQYRLSHASANTDTPLPEQGQKSPFPLKRKACEHQHTSRWRQSITNIAQSIIETFNPNLAGKDSLADHSSGLQEGHHPSFRLPSYCTVIPFPSVPSLLLTCTVSALSAQGSLLHSEFKGKRLRACTQSSYHRVTNKMQMHISVYLSVKYFDHPCTSTNQPPYYCTANRRFKKIQTS